MPEPATQVCADDEPGSLHFTQVLSEHFSSMSRGNILRELAQSRGSSLETGENSDFPLPLNQRDRELNGLVAFVLGTDDKELLFLHLFFRAYPCRMDMGLRTVSDIIPSRLLPEFA